MAVDTHRLSSASHVLLAPYLCLSTRQEPILAGALNLPASPLSRLRAATIWTFRGSAAHETKHELPRPRFAGVAATSLACAPTCNFTSRRDCPSTEAPTRDQGCIRVSAPFCGGAWPFNLTSIRDTHGHDLLLITIVNVALCSVGLPSGTRQITLTTSLRR